jgi:hypothetical protein
MPTGHLHLLNDMVVAAGMSRAAGINIVLNNRSLKLTLPGEPGPVVVDVFDCRGKRISHTAKFGAVLLFDNLWHSNGVYSYPGTNSRR